MSEYSKWVRAMNDRLNIAEQESYFELCLKLYAHTRKILKDNFGNQKDSDMVDIRELVSKYGIKIEEKKFYDKGDLFLKQLSGYLDQYYYEGKLNSIIYIHKELGELDKRYVIAHEFAHKLLGSSDNKTNSAFNCINVLFPKEKEEFMSDLVASYLMLPLDRVLKLMDSFIEKKKDELPIHMIEWIRYLASHMKLSEYQTVLCFQNIRYLACIAYNQREEFPEIDFEKYKEFFQ